MYAVPMPILLVYFSAASHEQLRQFLKVIQPKFLEVVDPRESGLLDFLYSADLLTDTDHESMSGKDVNTRKDQVSVTFRGKKERKRFRVCVFSFLLLLLLLPPTLSLPPPPPPGRLPPPHPPPRVTCCFVSSSIFVCLFAFLGFCLLFLCLFVSFLVFVCCLGWGGERGQGSMCIFVCVWGGGGGRRVCLSVFFFF